MNKENFFIENIEKKDLGEKAVLNYLYDNNELAFPTDLVNNLHICSSRIAAILKQLEKKSLITRDLDEIDKRKVVVHLTLKGKAEVERFSLVIDQRIEYLKGKLGKEKIDSFFETAQEIKIVMEDFECYN